MARVTKFLNVDFEIFSSKRLTTFIKAFEESGTFVIHSGRLPSGKFHASFELDGRTSTPDRAIRKFIRLIDGLPLRLYSQLLYVERRVFSIGIQSGTRQHTYIGMLSPEILRKVVNMNAEIELTVYTP